MGKIIFLMLLVVGSANGRAAARRNVSEATSGNPKLYQIITDNPLIDLETAQKVIDVADKSLCKIHFSEDKQGSGFLGSFKVNNEKICGLFTCNSIITSEPELENAKVRCGKENEELKIKHIELFTSVTLDVTFIKFSTCLVSEISVEGAEFLSLPTEPRDIFIPQYPSDVVAAFAMGRVIESTQRTLYHRASTTKDSCGSPVLSGNDLVVMAIQKSHRKGNDNEATLIQPVLRKFEKEIIRRRKERTTTTALRNELTTTAATIGQ